MGPLTLKKLKCTQVWPKPTPMGPLTLKKLKCTPHIHLWERWSQKQPYWLPYPPLGKVEPKQPPLAPLYAPPLAPLLALLLAPIYATLRLLWPNLF